MSGGQPVALDACVLLNLLATGRPLTEFADAAGWEFTVVAQAEQEIVWLNAEDPDQPREQVQLGPLLEAGELTRLVLEPDELERFVELARVLDDGEAATLAVAELRGLAVATDDRKARRVAATLNPSPPMTSTAAIIRAWATGRTDAELRTCIKRIQIKASFVPSRTDPDGSWWQDRTE